MKGAWAVALSVAAALFTGRASALDKQGSAHKGQVEGSREGFDVSGNVFLGSAIVNPTYASRPDNSGHLLLRFGAHADIDLIGRRLSLPLDVNFFTDRDRPGAGVLVPSEGDVIGGVTSTFPLGPGALELGVRGEHDAPLDRGGITQSYVDARARYLYSLADAIGVPGPIAGEDLTGWITLGGFVFNPTYPSRPDNTGRALFRYGVHAEMSFFEKRLGFGVDTVFFTDRRSNDPLGPSELDVTPSVVGRLEPFELQLAYERDMPVDRGGLVQQLLYVLVTVPFDAKLNRNARVESPAD